jgi:hypothetical protein
MFDFHIAVWIEEEKKYLCPTIYTVDYLNNFITFDWLGKTYTTTLDKVMKQHTQ